MRSELKINLVKVREGNGADSSDTRLCLNHLFNILAWLFNESE